MRRMSGRLILAGCAAVLLVMNGCPSGTDPIGGTDGPEAAAREGGRKTKGAPFARPDGPGGRLLAETLAPAGKVGPLNNPAPSRPPAPPLLRFTETAPAAPEGEPLVTRLPNPAPRRKLEPRLVVEEG